MLFVCVGRPQLVVTERQRAWAAYRVRGWWQTWKELRAQWFPRVELRWDNGLDLDKHVLGVVHVLELTVCTQVKVRAVGTLHNPIKRKRRGRQCARV